MTQADIIRVVTKRQPIHASAIARELDRDVSEIATPLSRLVAKNILRRESVPDFETKLGKRTVTMYRIVDVGP